MVVIDTGPSQSVVGSTKSLLLRLLRVCTTVLPCESTSDRTSWYLSDIGEETLNRATMLTAEPEGALITA